MADLATLENSTAALILQLQIEDLEQLASRSKGKTRVDKPSDADVAFQLYKADLDRWSVIVASRSMAESVGTAVVTDGACLAACQAQERLEMRDHEKARRMVGMDAFAKKVPAGNGNLTTGGIMHKLQHVQVTGVYDCDGVEASSSRSCGKGPPLGRRIECGVCRENKLFFDVTQIPCGDRYCRDCLQKLFEASIAGESLFPPRCCRKPLVMKTAQPFLTTDVVKRYNARKEELETPNRTYCYSPICAKVHTSHLD